MKEARSISASQPDGATHRYLDCCFEAPAFVFDQDLIDTLASQGIGLRLHLSRDVSLGRVSRQLRGVPSLAPYEVAAARKGEWNDHGAHAVTVQ